jgi:hypothetical protein
LAIEQDIIEPAEVRDNPAAFRCIGEEVTEMLDYQPANPQRIFSLGWPPKVSFVELAELMMKSDSGL